MAIPTNTASMSGKRPLWIKAIKASMIVRLVPFILFLSLFAILYIYNGHEADGLVRQMADAQRQLKQKQYEYKTLKAELMYSSKESELAEAVQPLGLIKPAAPPMQLNK